MQKDTKGILVGDVVYVVDVVTEFPSFKKVLVSKVTNKTVKGSDMSVGWISEYTFRSSTHSFSKSFDEARKFWIENNLQKKVEIYQKAAENFQRKIAELESAEDI